MPAETPAAARQTEKTFRIAAMPVVLQKGPKTQLADSDAKAIDDRIDTLLAAQSSVRVLSRQFMAELLRERATGLANLSAQQQQQWRQFMAAGAYLCPVLKATKGKQFTLTLELIAVQNGRRLLERHIQGSISAPEAWLGELRGAIAGLCRELPTAVGDLENVLLMEPSLKLPAELPHTRHLVPLLQSTLQAALDQSLHVRALTPRFPQCTREERLLRLAGLTDARHARNGSQLIALKPTPDGRLTIEFAEKAIHGPVDQFPITAAVVLRADAKIIYSRALKGKLGAFPAFRARIQKSVGEAAAALARHVGREGPPRPIEVQEARARRQAQAELESVKHLTKVPSGELSHAQSARIAGRALRAWHLNPASEQAAYLACTYAKYLHPTDSKGNLPEHAYWSAIELCKRYHDQFGPKAGHYREVANARFTAGWRIYARAEPVSWRRRFCLECPHTPALFRPGREMARGLADVAWWELAHRERSGNTIEVWLAWVMKYIPHIPAGQLQEELDYWRTFYNERFLPAWKAAPASASGSGNQKSYCWEILLATFYARMEEPEKVRQCLQRAAAKYPRSDRGVWRDRGQFISVLLKHAGDPQWKTWKPEFSAVAKVPVRSDALTSLVAYHNRNHSHRRSPAALLGKGWDRFLPAPAVVPAARVIIPKEVQDKGLRPSRYEQPRKTQPFGVIGDDWILFVAPGLDDYLNLETDTHLFVARREPLLGRAVSVTSTFYSLPWPDYPRVRKSKRGDNLVITDYLVRDAKGGAFTLWVGTAYHGVAKIARGTGGKTAGRWYTPEDGYPQGHTVYGLWPGRYKAASGILMLLAEREAKRASLYFLNPKTHKFTFLAKDPWPTRIRYPDGTIACISGTRPFVNEVERSLPAWNSMQAGGVLTNAGRKALETLDLAKATFSASALGGHVMAYDAESGVALAIGAGRLAESNISAFDVGRNKAHTVSRTLPASSDRFEQPLGMEGLSIGTRCTVPLGYITTAVAVGQYVCIGMNYRDHNWTRTGDMLFIWKPGANLASPLKGDRWYGPFRLPAGRRIVGMMPDPKGCLWASTYDSHLFRVDVAAAVRDAQRTGRVFDSKTFMDRYLGALTKWRDKVRFHMSNQEIDKAIAEIDRQWAALDSASPKHERTDLLMFKAAACTL
ncbi:MAG: hypothetical protein AMK72_09950, partial [Planctomycetes bacterium SM23_25]